MTDLSTMRTRLIAAAALVSLLGLLFHNWWDLPDLTLLSPENSGPTLVFIVIFGTWLRWPRSRVSVSLLLLWGVIHFVGGGIVSVLPFDFLPFYPEQSLQHYLGHLVYSATQLPLLLLLIQELRRIEECIDAASETPR